MNDKSECAALRAVAGPHIENVLVSSTKSCMGHLIAAAGAVEAAVCALAIRDGIAPVNANLETPDPDCDGQHRARKIAAEKNPRRAFQFARLRRLEQLPRVPQPGGSEMNPRKVVFTGLGAVCGAGKTVDEIFDAIVNGRSAVAPITQFDASRWPVRIAAECNVDNRTLVADRKLHKSISRTDLFGLYAADMAVQQSGLSAHREKMDARAGSKIQRPQRNHLPVRAAELTAAATIICRCSPPRKASCNNLARELGNTVNPMWLLKNLPNNVLCHVGIRHNFKGTNTTITNQCAGGIMAVAESAAAIRAGEADRNDGHRPRFAV